MGYEQLYNLSSHVSKWLTNASHILRLTLLREVTQYLNLLKTSLCMLYRVNMSSRISSHFKVFSIMNKKSLHGICHKNLMVFIFTLIAVQYSVVNIGVFKVSSNLQWHHGVWPVSKGLTSVDWIYVTLFT